MTKLTAKITDETKTIVGPEGSPAKIALINDPHKQLTAPINAETTTITATRCVQNLAAAAGITSSAITRTPSGYIIAERTATQILRDPFTNKPFVHFYATKRIGGQVLDSAAIKLLKIEV